MKTQYQQFLEKYGPDELSRDTRTEEEKEKEREEEGQIHEERYRQIMLSERMFNTVFVCPICGENTIGSADPYSPSFCVHGHNVKEEPVSTICHWCNSYFPEYDSCTYNEYMTFKNGMPLLGCFRFKWREGVSAITQKVVLDALEELEFYMFGRGEND